MQTVAIVGASGYIGRRVVDEFLRIGGYKIRVLVRSATQSLNWLDDKTDVDVFEGDLRAPETLHKFLEYGCIVINLVYLWEGGEARNLEIITNLLEACKAAKIKRLVHCSTAAVVGRVTDNLITENTTCRPITEYGVTKLRLENLIIETSQSNFDVVILRPTSVFGPGGAPLNKLARDIVAGNRLMNYLKLCLFGQRRMNLVSVANVVGSIIFFVKHEQDFDGEIFIVSDDDSLINNFSDVENYLTIVLEVEKFRMPRLPLPLGLLAFLLSRMGRNNINPRCNYSSQKLKNAGFEFPVMFETALAEYANWYRTSNSNEGATKIL
jgi:nucleoside-diphosphate-sugar epimerase